METKNKSPARITRGRQKKNTPISTARKSPSRKSPSRKQSPEKSKMEKATKEKVAELKLVSDKGRLSPTKNLKIRLDKMLLSTGSSVQKKMTISSADTIDIGPVSLPSFTSSSVTTTKPEDISGDSEVTKITSSVIRRSVSVTKLTPSFSTHHLTPTPSATATTELSRQSRSASRSVYDDASKTEYSDDDDEEQEEVIRESYSNYRTGVSIYKPYSKPSSMVSRQIPVPREFGGAFGIGFLLLLIPVLVYYLQWSCEKTTSCSFLKVSLSALIPNINTIRKFFPENVVYAYISYMLTIFISLSIIPIGRQVKLPSGDHGVIQYNFNAFALSVLAIIACFLGEFLQYRVAEFIMKNYLTLILFHILSALILSLWCYIRARFLPPTTWNPYAKSGNILIDFGLGREIDPKWFQMINIKLLTYRTSLITTLILLQIFIYKSIQIPKVPNTTDVPLTTTEIIQYFYENTKLTNFTAFFSAVLVLIYNFDLIWNEHHLTTSFELQQEGVGALLLLRYAVTPFLIVSVSKYALDKNVPTLPLWTAIITLIIFISGLILKRASNSLKYRYRMDPYRIDLALMDTVPTFQGRRLLLGKLWGTVRQPNYAGDIISLVAITIPLYAKFAWPPFISVLLLIIYLIHRAIRVNARNFARYDSAWTRYCTKVPYMILPKIF